MGNLTEPVVTL